jgi:hypothetical protein
MLLLVFSCKKGNADFTITGTITDQTFVQNLAGAKVKLFQVPVASTSLNEIGSMTLGSDGKYSFTFPRDKMEKYVLKVTKSGYFDLEKTIFFSDLTIEEDNIRNYGTTAKSWVKLTFLNQNPSAGDHLQYIKQAGKEGCAECCTDTEQHLYGAVDTSIYCINDGNTIYSYLYWVIGTTDQGLKSVSTTAFDTTEIVLNY